MKIILQQSVSIKGTNYYVVATTNNSWYQRPELVNFTIKTNTPLSIIEKEDLIPVLTEAFIIKAQQFKNSGIRLGAYDPDLHYR